MQRGGLPQVVVVGVGGVGGYFGGRLAQAGHCHMHFIARGAILNSLKSRGLRVNSILGNFHVDSSSFVATDDTASISVPLDLVMVAVKGEESLRAALPSIKNLISDTTTVLPLQNGVEAPNILMEALGEDKVLGGYCKIVSRIIEPGHIVHEGAEPVIGLGEILPDRIKTNSERVKKIADLFVKSGIKVELPQDIRVGMWHKLMLIASVSGLGACTRAPLAANMRIPETSELLKAALREVASVARAHGINLTEQAADEVHQYFATMSGKTPNATSSMQRDIVNGVPSELPWQSGAVVKKGKEVGVPTPVHSFFYATLLPQEKKARKEIEYTLITNNL